MAFRSFKDVNFHLDIDKLNENLERKEIEAPPAKVGVRTTIFSMTNGDQRVGNQPIVSTPDLFLLKILKDGLQNPYVELFWRIPRADVERDNIVGFEIYRKKISVEGFFKETRRDLNSIKNFSSFGFDRYPVTLQEWASFLQKGRLSIK